MATQNEERARAVKQARKLMEMTTAQGASDNEAKMAMDRLSKIRNLFNLTLDEIVVSTLEYQEKTTKQTAVKGCVMDTVVVMIGRFTDCKVWSTPGKKQMDRKYRWRAVEPGQYHFFGIDSDVEMAVYLFDMIAKRLQVEEKIFMRSDDYQSIHIRGGKRRALVSFRKAFARQINNRLWDLNNNRDVDNTENVQAGDKDIVLVKEKVREQKFQEQLGIKLTKRKTYNRGITSGTGAMAGSSAANNVSFNRPVGGSGSGQKLIGG